MKNICLLYLCLFSSILANAQTINSPILDSLFQLLEEKQQTMGTIYVQKDGEQLYTKSIGYSSLEENIKADNKTKYRVGSVTKVFTATLILQLVDEEKINLEDPLAAFFPQMPNAEKISISNLLNHSSGLFNIIKSKNFNPYEAKTAHEMLAIMADFEPEFEPGSKSEYSNTNYILLGYIIEKVENKPYKDILEDRIASKLGLNDTYYGGPIKTENNEAQSYRFADIWELSQSTDMSLPHGAGAVVSTPRDMAVFIQALFNQELISDRSLTQMTSQNNEMGFGLSRIIENNKLIYGHDGTIDGFSSLLVYVPEDRLAIAFAANGNQYPNMAIVRNAFLASYNQSFELPSFEDFNVVAEDLEKYVGTYASPDAPMKLTFIHKDGNLLGAPAGQDPTLLRPTKKHQFKLEQAGITLDFIPEEDGLIFSQGGNSMSFKKDK